jgi:DnaJ-class molecular chaperone
VTDNEKMIELAGKAVRCASCGGHGLVADMAGEPDECGVCGGSGQNWRYPGGAVARYYSGPLIGRDCSRASSKGTGV